jgi:glucosamine--fructose-6-phosphate aminotransferase (isomerizing)
MISQSG